MTRRDAMPERAGRGVTRKVARGFKPDRFALERLAGEDSYRHQLGLPAMSVADLARLSGVSPTTIYGWEQGTRSPQANLLLAVATVLRIPMDRLIVIDPDERTLADLRWLAGLTQPEAAKRMSMSTQSFGRTERGEMALSKDRALGLAALYSVEETVVHAAWQRAHDRPAGAPA